MVAHRTLGFQPVEEPKFHESQEIPSKIHANTSHLLIEDRNDQFVID